jgi:hypothetical protein
MKKEKRRPGQRAALRNRKVFLLNLTIHKLLKLWIKFRFAQRSMKSTFLSKISIREGNGIVNTKIL